MTDEQLDKLEQLKAKSDAGGGRDKATTSNFVLYNLYRTAVMDAAPELLAAARENAALRRELSEAEPKGYRRGLEEATNICKSFETRLWQIASKNGYDLSREAHIAFSLAQAMEATLHPEIYETLEKEERDRHLIAMSGLELAAPDTEAGGKANG